ncbi:MULTISPECIES: LysR family transcriptional regulator [unclassified Pseudomonas]|uniref:LysR family transcriptional regulator n=1 Tax=unclassified Pseudomonas TaxID=196821 RepID=UPI00160BB678|nr:MULTISPECIES: LysR family transcriptional regulator [unclassified Pseudomonas]MBB6290540.1 DNA-binding transcriptional LysR family regulator [Pseudomonas sp. SJZ073]MBB6315733.1 DNA-binding transcriptional LysR family regulator [Pseudomonas sp. JAI120]
MELRHLRYFVVVAEEEHMTRAAQRLNIQQPPLSSQIRDLEREMEVQLFDRTPRSIRLNAAGHVFLKEARELLTNVDRAVMRAQQAARGEYGRIAVGYTSSASLHPKVPQLIRAFHTRYPTVALDTHEDTTRDLLDAMLEESLDAVFVRSTTLRYPMLKSVVLCQEPMVVALPIGHHLAQESGPIALSALRAEGIVLYRRASGPGIQDVLFAAFLEAGFTPRIVADVPRLLSAVTLVAAGKGITIVPETLRSLHRESVKYRDIDTQSSYTVPLTLVYRHAPEDSPLYRFVQMAHEDGDQ